MSARAENGTFWEDGTALVRKNRGKIALYGKNPYFFLAFFE